MTKVIKVSDEFHAYLKMRAEQDKRTIIATLDIVMDEIMGSKPIEDAKRSIAPKTCPEHNNCPIEDCAMMMHRKKPAHA